MPRAETGVRDGARQRELIELEAQRPELLPWLRPLRVALSALALEPWRSLAPLCTTAQPAGVPLLHESVVPLDPNAVSGHVRAVLAAAFGTSARPQLEAIDPAALLHAAVAQDELQLAALAASAELDGSSLSAAAQLAALPLLQGCARAVAPHPVDGWTFGYCHVCGAPPLLAEMLGLERTRQLRCGRCGASWRTQVLLCPFCGEREHARLGALVPDGATGQTCWIETCATCRGYLKVRAVLRAAAPETVLLDDARSLELDCAALERGFEKSHRSAFPVLLRIAPATTPVS